MNASAVVQAARAADVAILVLGLNQEVEREGLDRVDITLPGMQDKLFEAVYQTGTPTVVVLVHGGALAIENIKEKADAIVDAFYPGENGGFAIADVLFGDYNPGGTIPPLHLARPLLPLKLLVLSSRSSARYSVHQGLCEHGSPEQHEHESWRRESRSNLSLLHWTGR